MATATGKDVAVPAPHPPEFRRRAVELARQKTKPVAELAKELRISELCLRNWMAQADVDDKGVFDLGRAAVVRLDSPVTLCSHRGVVRP